MTTRKAKNIRFEEPIDEEDVSSEVENASTVENVSIEGENACDVAENLSDFENVSPVHDFVAAEDEDRSRRFATRTKLPI